jgi:hypothetical protein
MQRWVKELGEAQKLPLDVVTSFPMAFLIAGGRHTVDLLLRLSLLALDGGTINADLGLMDEAGAERALARTLLTLQRVRGMWDNATAGSSDQIRAQGIWPHEDDVKLRKQRMQQWQQVLDCLLDAPLDQPSQQINLHPIFEQHSTDNMLIPAASANDPAATIRLLTEKVPKGLHGCRGTVDQQQWDFQKALISELVWLLAHTLPQTSFPSRLDASIELAPSPSSRRHAANRDRRAHSHAPGRGQQRK